jgi:hypothetical protein
MIEEAEMSLTNMAFARDGQYAGDENLLVRFFKQPYQNATRSEAEGRPIFEELDFIEIRFPGNKLSVIVEKVNAEHKKRFPDHWRRYAARDTEEVIDGTPLDQWPGVTRSQVEELRFLNVRSLEQLISMADNHSSRIMGINILKSKAKAYLEAAKLQGEANALLETKRQLDEQTELNKKLVARLDILEEIAEVPKKRMGRPPKAVVDERIT